MEKGLSLRLSSRPLTERSMLLLWTSSLTLDVGWLSPTSSRRRSRRLRPQWWMPGWWLRCEKLGFRRASISWVGSTTRGWYDDDSPSIEPSAAESTRSLSLSLRESRPPTTSISSLRSMPEPEMLLFSLLLLRNPPFREFEPPPAPAAALRDSHSAFSVDRSTVMPCKDIKIGIF